MPSRTASRAIRRPATTARPLATRLSGAGSRDSPAFTHAFAPGARLPAIQQRYMPGVYRIVLRRILPALEHYDDSPLTYRGRRIVRTWESEAATAPSADILTAAFVRWSIPCGGRPRPPRSSGKPDRGLKASLDNAAIFALARAHIPIRSHSSICDPRCSHHQRPATSPWRRRRGW